MLYVCFVNICTFVVPRRDEVQILGLLPLLYCAYLHLNIFKNINNYKMSSNIEVQRICQHCGKEFTARTTVTQYCGDDCAKRAYKARQRAARVEASNKETLIIKTKPIEVLKAKEFLTVREVATLLNCSVRSIYYYIRCGNIKAVNLAERVTRVKRSEIDKLFN
jgi:excisionase family DNA binding protein